jgi:hypothetical protein
MNKILLITISTALLATLFACTPLVNIAPAAEDVTSVASEIADFELPDGYGPDFTTSLLGYTVVAYNPGDGHSHLYLIQSEKESDGEKLAQMLADLAPASSDPNTRMTVIENRPAIVRGQEVTVVISDGVNHEGDTYRQAMVAFQGKGGPAMLVLSEPLDRWNDETVDALLASIE